MPGDLTTGLLTRLETLRPVLEIQGVLQRRSDPGICPSWRIRYRAHGPGGCGRHCSMALGNDEQLARAAWSLVETWRQERRMLDQEQAAKLLEDQRFRRSMRACRRMAILAGGQGGWRRRRNGKEFDAAVNGSPLSALKYIISAPFLEPNRRPGRPRKSRLW